MTKPAPKSPSANVPFCRTPSPHRTSMKALPAAILPKANRFTIPWMILNHPTKWITRNALLPMFPWNPVSWVFVPVKCALQWAFYPSQDNTETQMLKVQQKAGKSGIDQLPKAFNASFGAYQNSFGQHCQRPECICKHLAMTSFPLRIRSVFAMALDWRNCRHSAARPSSSCLARSATSRSENGCPPCSVSASANSGNGGREMITNAIINLFCWIRRCPYWPFRFHCANLARFLRRQPGLHFECH